MPDRYQGKERRAKTLWECVGCHNLFWYERDLSKPDGDDRLHSYDIVHCPRCGVDEYDVRPLAAYDPDWEPFLAETERRRKICEDALLKRLSAMWENEHDDS